MRYLQIAKGIINMFYDIFIKLCHDNNISPTKILKEYLHMSSGNMTKWKAGQIPKVDTVKKIADYFNVSVDFLLGDDNIKHEFPQQDIEKTRRIETLFAEKGLPFDDKTVSLFLDFVAANAEIIKRQMGENK